MAFFLRQGAIAVLLGMLLFCISCEKHPLGQMPEVQREQPDPAKGWSDGKGHPEEPSNTHKPGEAHEGH
jgi:hypothetical protein